MDTTQLTFLLYLLLGQAVLLGLWTLVRRRAPVDAAAPGRLLQVGFAVYLLLGQIALFVGWDQLRDVWESAGTVAKADLVVTVHFGFVLFVLGLQVLILVGWSLRWTWTRNFWLRLLHLVCIEIVVGQAVVSLECPLTGAERDLRGSLMPDDPRDTELGFSAILAGDLVGSRSENVLTTLVLATGCTTATPPGKGGGTPYIGWGYFYVAQLHYLEGASPVARFCHEKLFYPIPERYYQYVVAPFGLLMLLTWIFVPPRMPGQRPSTKQELATSLPATETTVPIVGSEAVQKAGINHK